MRKTLLIIDGLNLIRRLYAALEREDDTLRRIERTQSVAVDHLTRLLHQFTPSHAIVVFDTSGKTWRHDVFPEYKLGRKPMDDALLEALPAFAKAFRFNGVASLRLQGWEADDLIATLALKAAKQSIKSFIVSTDKGFCQLLSHPEIRQYDCFSKQGFDAEWVLEKYGVPAETLTQYWALVGDTTNRIPGVKGIGPKSAVKILQVSPTIETIFENLECFTEKQRVQLYNHVKQCLLSRKLVTLETNVDIGIRLSQLSYPRPNSETTV